MVTLKKYFLEYKSDLEGPSECYTTIHGTLYLMLTKSQKNKNQIFVHPLDGNDTYTLSASNVDQGAKIS